MRNLLLIRFDLAPRRDVSQVLSNHMKGKGNMIGMPGVVMTTFTTESDIEDIHKELSQLEDCFYVLTNPTKDTVKVSLPEPINRVINKEIDNKPVSKEERIATLTRRMNQAVQEQRFEDAADLRDLINDIK